MNRKFVIILTLISILTFSTGISLAIEPIDNELEKAELECKKLGFKSGAEMFKCKFQLFEVRKKIQIENGEIALAKQTTANKRLDFEIARLKNCGNLLKEGISFHPKSPYYSICADVVVQNVNSIVPHAHEIPQKDIKFSTDASVLKEVNLSLP